MMDASICWQDWHGNRCADRLAKRGAAFAVVGGRWRREGGWVHGGFGGWWGGGCVGERVGRVSRARVTAGGDGTGAGVACIACGDHVLHLAHQRARVGDEEGAGLNFQLELPPRALCELLESCLRRSRERIVRIVSMVEYG